MKKKVLIVTESISYGGLNLASVHFQQYLDKDKFECVWQQEVKRTIKTVEKKKATEKLFLCKKGGN